MPHATPEKPGLSPSSTPAQQQGDNGQLLFSIGIAALWIGLLGYAFFLAPNQTPYRDQIFIERILGIGQKDGYVVDPVFVGLFNIMGIYPAIYASLLVPAGRSENKVRQPVARAGSGAAAAVAAGVGVGVRPGGWVDRGP